MNYLFVLVTRSPKPKVAFLSSQDRTYYPEDPGCSRFGIEYALNQHDDEVPNPSVGSNTFSILEKPWVVSRKGYGIGGLSGPRFPIDIHELVPAPNVYQPHISKTIREMEQQTPIEKLNLEDLRRECVKHNYAFGLHKNIPRFGKEKLFNMVG